METRLKAEYKIYILELAGMHGGVDKAQPVAVFDDLQKLKDYYNSQLAEQPYQDKGYNRYAGNDDYNYNKVFKKGSPLEWYNPANNLEEASYQDCVFGGVRSDWCDNLNFRVPFNPN